MAKVIVEYTASFKQTLDWPDDELDGFNHNNLQANLSPSGDDLVSYEFEILDVNLNGKHHVV